MTVRISFVDENPLLIEETLSLFTNYSKVEVDQMDYDKEKGWLEIPLRRRKVDFQKTFFGKKTKYRGKEIRSVLRIENVERLDLRKAEGALKKLAGIFTMLFGPKVDERAVYISSGEEERGKPVVEIAVYVSRINVSLIDLE